MESLSKIELELWLSSDDVRIADLIANSLKLLFEEGILETSGKSTAEGKSAVYICLDFNIVPLYRIYEFTMMQARKFKTEVMKTKVVGEDIPVQVLREVAGYYLQLE